jgi:NADH:ubiquinone oxidoreductase subunit 6 (subunit J)
MWRKEKIMTPMVWAILILAIGFVLTSILVLVAKNLVAIISAIGLGSVILAVIFFIFDAPFAGAIELSVGAGLISVLFIIATSVTDRAADEVE